MILIITFRSEYCQLSNHFIMSPIGLASYTEILLNYILLKLILTVSTYWVVKMFQELS